jgi:ketosteroid isomerase-like protein
MPDVRVTEPSELHPAWASRFNERDVAGMLALAEPASAFVPQPGTIVTGDDVAGALQQFLDIGLPITMSVRHVIRADDLALVIVDWSLKGTGADGQEVDMVGTTADVARLGPEGWRFVIDNPFGTA